MRFVVGLLLPLLVGAGPVIWSGSNNSRDISGAGLLTSAVDINGNFPLVLTGTVSVTAGSANVVGVGTLFQSELSPDAGGNGSRIKIGNENFAVLSIADNTHLTLSANHTAGASGVPYYTNDFFFRIRDGAGNEFFKVASDGQLSVVTGIGLKRRSTGNTVSIVPSPFSGSSYAVTLPPDQGAAGTSLVNDGAGSLSWASSGVTSWKHQVVAASFMNVDLNFDTSPGSTIDDYLLQDGDRVLLAGQSDPTENGIYIISGAGAPSRATDADTLLERQGAIVSVQQGTLYANKVFQQTGFIIGGFPENETWTNLLSGYVSFTGLTIAETDGGTGNVPHACTRRTATQTNAGGTATVCSAGEYAMGGGCQAAGAQAIRASYPPGTNSQRDWTCTFDASNAWIAHVMCCVY